MRENSMLMTIALLVALLPVDADARREVMTPKQKERLAKVDTILVEMLALTDRGEVDPALLTSVVVRRFEELGYGVVTDPQRPHDVVFKVKCEQRKVWEGTITSGGDADLPDLPSRVWKGPACQLTYVLRGKNLGWRKEVRTEFQDAMQAAAAAHADDPGAYALTRLKDRLEDYDFPVLVTADWGQADRLLALLDHPSTPEARTLTIIDALGRMFAEPAVPRLVRATQTGSTAVASAATRALGEIGKPETVPLLTALLDSEEPMVQAAAARALGQVGALNFDYSMVDPLLAKLKTTKDVRVMTAIVRALGRLPDRRSFDALVHLQETVGGGGASQADPEIAELRKALAWSLRQIRPADHTFDDE